MNFFARVIREVEKNPPRLIALGFLFVIVTGALLLSLPISNADGMYTNPIDSFFTATSAVCVTGLVTVNTFEYWSTFGQVVIITLIQFGGLGFMTWAILLSLIMKKRITLRERLVIHEQMNALSLKGMVKLIIYVLKATLVIELIGALLLSFTFIPEYGFIKGSWYSIFHSISSYCNAGFDLIGADSISPYVKSITVILPISFLIILGGIGFNVFMDISNKRSFKRLAAHTKLVLVMTTSLLLGGTIIFLFLEYSNEYTIKSFSFFEKLLASFFQSVTTRTAGYSSLNQSLINDSSAIVTIILMFIGGSPAGTAGGIKTTTLGLLLFTTKSEIAGQEDVVVFNRRIPLSTIRKAIAIVIISMSWIMMISLILTITEKTAFINILYEVTSAFGTVGLTRSLTPLLSTMGKVFIMLTMYLGRLGPLTLAYAFYSRERKKSFREPKGDILVG